VRAGKIHGDRVMIDDCYDDDDDDDDDDDAMLY